MIICSTKSRTGCFLSQGKVVIYMQIPVWHQELSYKVEHVQGLLQYNRCQERKVLLAFTTCWAANHMHLEHWEYLLSFPWKSTVISIQGPITKIYDTISNSEYRQGLLTHKRC